jgi:hypothetical protein
MVVTVDFWTVVAGAATLGITSRVVEFVWKTHLEKKLRKLDAMIFNKKLREERKREEKIHNDIIKRIESLEKAREDET